MSNEDSGSEADALNDWWDGDDDDPYYAAGSSYDPLDPDEDDGPWLHPKVSSYSKPLSQLAKREKGKVKNEQHNNARKNAGRMRCLQVGCNPILDVDSAKAHSEETAHRTAAWPVRSIEGTRRAKARNRTGYYDKYNVDKPRYR
jgi:hypothetical protein